MGALHNEDALPLLILQLILDKVVEGRVDLLHVSMRDQQLFMRVLQHMVNHIDVNSTTSSWLHKSKSTSGQLTCLTL
eukprot:14852149-Heterocapsa_arctica.AAC.1